MLKNLKNAVKQNHFIKAYLAGAELLNDPHYKECRDLDNQEKNKTPLRTDVLNFLLRTFKTPTSYLEIGVRNPEHNFNHIQANEKYSVDPGIEFHENPVDFPLTSDDFFDQLRSGSILSKDIKFNVIFIDGLHLAEQVDRDIQNALEFITDDGYIVLHDCNPPTEWHARYKHAYRQSPALSNWNGTTWKAFLKWRSNPNVGTCCIDTDWGLGIISKNTQLGNSVAFQNEFYEYHLLHANRKELFNLIDFNSFKDLISKI